MTPLLATFSVKVSETELDKASFVFFSDVFPFVVHPESTLIKLNSAAQYRFINK